MFVYAYWDSTAGAPPQQAELMTLWERSWRARGWEPRLLTKNLKYRKGAKPVTWICPIHVINFSFTPAAYSNKYIEDYGRPGWKTSPLVDFGFSAAASDILHCGRMLRI